MKLVEKLLKQNGVVTKGPESQQSGGGANQSGSAAASEAGGGGQQQSAEEAAASAQSGADKGAGASSATPASQASEQSSSAAAQQPLAVEVLLKELEGHGIKVATIDELRKPEPVVELSQAEKDQLDQKRRNEIRSFALTTGKVKSTELDAFARESTMPDIDLGYARYKEARLKELTDAQTPTDQLPADKDIRAEFDELNFQYADPTDPKRITAEKRLKFENDLYLQETYPAIYEMDENYAEHEQTTQLRQLYDTTVDEAINGLGTEIPFDLKDGDQTLSYPVKFNDAEKAAIAAAYKGDNLFNVLGRTKTDKAKVAEAIKNAIIIANLPRIISDIANAHASAKLDAAGKGRRNIVPPTIPGNNGVEKKTSPGVKKILAAQKN